MVQDCTGIGWCRSKGGSTPSRSRSCATERTVSVLVPPAKVAKETYKSGGTQPGPEVRAAIKLVA